MALASSSTRAPPLFLVFSTMLSLLLLLASSSHAAADTPAVLCNANSYSDGDPFEASLAQLLQEMVWSASWAGGGDAYDALPSQAPLLYGHAVCRPGLVGDDCKLCISYAATRMVEICEHSIGASATSADNCRVRYEQYAFTD